MSDANRKYIIVKYLDGVERVCYTHTMSGSTVESLLLSKEEADIIIKKLQKSFPEQSYCIREVI